MKKLTALLLSALILISVFALVPAYAAGYVKDTILKISFTADDIDKSFTALEGRVTFGKELTLDKDSVEFPHISDAESSVESDKILFNSTNLNNYDISSDKVIVSARFTVNEDITSIPAEAEIEDVYYVEDGALKDFENITLPYAMKANVEVIYTPGTEPVTVEATSEAVTQEASSQPVTENVTDASATVETENITEASQTADTEPVTSQTEATVETADVTSDTTYTPTQSYTDPTAESDTVKPTEKSSETLEPTEKSTEPSATDTVPPAVTTITLAKSGAVLYVKGKTTINATVKNGKGTLGFTSDKPKIAKVSSTGVVTALKKGTAKIIVSNNNVKKIFTVTVKNPKLNKKKVKLKKGKTFKLKIIGKIGKAKFKSSKKKIVAVTKKGKLKAKKKGKAVITVKTNGIKLKCKVTVK